MKTYKILFVALLVIVPILFGSCASTPSIEYESVVTKSVTGNDVAEVSLIPTFQEKNVWIGAEAGTYGYVLSVRNISDGIIRVNWEKSSISYNSNTALVFQEGQKYTDHNSPLAPATIPVTGSLTKAIYSSAQPRYISGKYGGWKMEVIPAYKTTVTICIEHNDIDSYYTFVCDAITKTN